jgi:hypothetical protein
MNQGICRFSAGLSLGRGLALNEASYFLDGFSGNQIP